MVGVDSLRYFWRRKPPDTLAQDLSLIVRAYGERWGTTEVALVKALTDRIRRADNPDRIASLVDKLNAL